MTSEVSDESVFHPPHLWGLDFHFNTFNKLYIADILTLKPYARYSGAFAYGSHPVYKVDVVGVVVRKAEKPKLFLYSVDDGTGVMNCCCWKTPVSDQPRSTVASELPHELRSRLELLQKEREAAACSYELGDLIHVRGKLKSFRDMMEIVSYYHRKIDNPNFQINRMLELPHLYRQCYDKPFELPYRIQQELIRINKGGGLTTQEAQSILEQLKEKVQKILWEKHIEEFSIMDLLKELEIADLIKKAGGESDDTSLMRQVLTQLEQDEGTVCYRHRSSPAYESLSRTSALERLTVRLLQQECSKPKYEEKGCHYLHLLDELHKTVQYSSLHKTALLHVLHHLETNSDVIRVTDRCYRPL